MSPLTPEQQALASDPAVLDMAQRAADRASWHYPNLLADEIQSAVFAAVVQAAATYDPSRGSLWRSHASHRIAGAIKDAVRDWYGGRNHWHLMRSQSLDEAIAAGDDTFAAVLADGSRPVGHEIERDDECDWLARQSGAARYQAVKLMLQPEHLTHKEVATLMGLSESRISQYASEAAKRLRESHDAGRIDLTRLVEIGGAA